MEDKRIQVMTILQDYFCRDTPLDVATDSILRLFSVVGQSEQCSGCEESTGETKLWCCNHCGKRIEDF